MSLCLLQVKRQNLNYYVSSQERFERKSELLEKQKPLDLEIERENIIQIQNKYKLLQLKEEYLSQRKEILK